MVCLLEHSIIRCQPTLALVHGWSVWRNQEYVYVERTHSVQRSNNYLVSQIDWKGFVFQNALECDEHVRYSEYINIV